MGARCADDDTRGWPAPRAAPMGPRSSLSWPCAVKGLTAVLPLVPRSWRAGQRGAARWRAAVRHGGRGRVGRRLERGRAVVGARKSQGRPVANAGKRQGATRGRHGGRRGEGGTAGGDRLRGREGRRRGERRSAHGPADVGVGKRQDGPWVEWRRWRNAAGGPPHASDAPKRRPLSRVLHLPQSHLLSPSPRSPSASAAQSPCRRTLAGAGPSVLPLRRPQLVAAAATHSLNSRVSRTSPPSPPPAAESPSSASIPSSLAKLYPQLCTGVTVRGVTAASLGLRPLLPSLPAPPESLRASSSATSSKLARSCKKMLILHQELQIGGSP